eukprot:COSAG04_NODE_898_length_9579_cov_2.950316_1_plen_69_part_10
MASAFQKVRATNDAMVGLFERFDVLAMPAFGEHCVPALLLAHAVCATFCATLWHIKRHTPDQTPPLLPS